MTRLLDGTNPELTIVFGRTKRRVDELAAWLEARGYKAKASWRPITTKTDERFTFIQNGNLDILVATDVAARGLDISGVTMSITTIFHKIRSYVLLYWSDRSCW